MSGEDSDDKKFYDAPYDQQLTQSTPAKKDSAAICLQDPSEGGSSRGPLTIQSNEVNIHQTINVRGSTFSGSTANIGMIGRPDSNAPREGPEHHADPGSSKTLMAHPLSVKFSRLCVKVARCFNSPTHFEELKVMVSAWSTGDFNQRISSSVSALSSVYQLITTGNEKCWWHWLDYGNLVHLINNMEYEPASECLREYDRELKTFCEDRLSSLISIAEPKSSNYDRSHLVNAFMKVKWEGEDSSFKVKHLYEVKTFLVNHLKIPPDAFIFSDVCPGCLCLQWALLGTSVCKTIEKRRLTCKFPIPVAGGSITAIEVVYSKFCRIGSKETFMYGKHELEILSEVSDYSKCPICFGITLDAAITICCQESFCTNCIIAAQKHSLYCPICRKNEYEYETSEFLDRKVIGNLQGRCCECKWEGDLFNSRSHSCTSKESSQMDTNTELTPTQADHPAQAMGTATTSVDEFEDIDCSMVSDTSSIASEKDPFLEQLQHLREGIQSLQDLLPGSQQRPVSRESGPDDVGAFRDALNTVGALLEQVEEHFHGYAASVTSDGDSKLSDVECDEKALPPGDRPVHQEEVEPVPSTVVSANTPVDIIPPQFPAQPDQPKGGSTVEPQVPRSSRPAKEEEPVDVKTGTEEMRAFQVEAKRMAYFAAAAGQHAVLEQLISSSGISIQSLSEPLFYTKSPPLHLAARNGHVETVKMLLAHGTSVTATDDCGSTPLHEAASSGSMDCLSAILNHNPDVNAVNRRKQTPFLVASSKGHSPVVKKLMECGASTSHSDINGQSALHLAVLSANISTVTCLLECGLSPNEANQKGTNPLHLAASKGYTDIAVALIGSGKADLKMRSNRDMTPLMYAVSTGHVETATQLVKCGADVMERDGRGRSLLHLAVLSRSSAMVESLVSLGCNVSDSVADLQKITSPPRQRHFVDRRRRHRLVVGEDDDDEYFPAQPCTDDVHVPGSLSISCTPFQLAVVLGEKEVIEFFLSRDADLTLKTKEGYSVLHLTAWKGHSDLTQKFISLGCDPNVTTDEGISPLHLASKFGRADVAAALIEGGCDVDGCSLGEKGKQASVKLTPFLTAAMEWKPDVIELLISKGCSVTAVTEDGSNAFHLGVTKLLSTSQDQRMMYNRFESLYEPFHVFPGLELRSAMEALKRAGCNINKLNSAGLAPLDLVEKSVPIETSRRDHFLLYQHMLIGSRDGFDFSTRLQNELSSVLMRLGAKTAQEIRREERLSQQLKSVSHSTNQVHSMYKSKLFYPSEVPRSRVNKLDQFAKNTPSMYQISSLVVPRVSSLWRVIGAHLELPSELVDGVQAEFQDSHECCLHLFKKWLEGDGVKPKTWQVVLDVLEAIGKESLSRSIRSDLQHHHKSSTPWPVV